MTQQNEAIRLAIADLTDSTAYRYDKVHRHSVDTLIEALRPLLDQTSAGVGEINGDTSDGYHTFNELYEHRHILFLHVLKSSGDKAWRSKLHSDGTMFEGWFIAGLETDLGQATYHLPVRMWGLFAGIRELDRAPEWDGHTSNDVLVRIREHALTQADQPADKDDRRALLDEIDITLDYFRDEFSGEKDVWDEPISVYAGGISANDLLKIKRALSGPEPVEKSPYRDPEWNDLYPGMD